ncbi:MAG: DMT family transporter [Waddliaceae bacterium]
MRCKESFERPSCVKATCSGAAAIGFWAMGAVLFCQLKRIPPFQLLALLQVAGGLIGILLGILLGRRQRPWRRLVKRFMCGWPYLLLLMANQIGYTLAFRLAPAAQVDLIYYTWPIMMVLAKASCQSQSLSKNQYFGLFLGFVSLIILVNPEIRQEGIQSDYFIGYITALLAGGGWVAYTLLNDNYTTQEQKETSLVEDIFLVGLMSCFIQSLNGGWIYLDTREVVILSVLSASVYGIAYPLWAYGVTHGKYTVMGGMANATPVLSVLCLVGGGMAELTTEILVSGVLVTAGCCFLTMSRVQITVRKRHFVNLYSRSDPSLSPSWVLRLLPQNL